MNIRNGTLTEKEERMEEREANRKESVKDGEVKLP